jgi:gamma-glutamyl:cysteine ligase YbdK (ATP-grasp superfamily)
MSDLPTKPGVYYWRVKDKDEWARVFEVRLSDAMGLCIDAGFYHETVQQRGGQWLPIPDADELVELQRKADAYDEGTVAWAVFGKKGNRVSNVRATCEAAVRDWLNIYQRNSWGTAKKQGYTCRKVRIVEEIEKGTE